MKTLILKNKSQANATLINNNFIDRYMVPANGEFVKVYLFLLRHLDDPCSSLTISMIADCMNNTENDILRAFRYWESEGLLSLETDEDGHVAGIGFDNTAFAVPHKIPAPKTVAESFTKSASHVSPKPKACLPSSSEPPKSNVLSKAIPLDSFKAQKELKSLFFIAEQYLAKTLSHTDVDAITYFYETLHMSADLIEYLIESCVENGHKSIHYIQKVALSWSDNGITTPEEAKQYSNSYSKNCYTVLKAFGIHNRGPAATEVAYIKKWTNEFGFTLDIVEEACNRTIATIHQPSFDYTDSILCKWNASQVKLLSDVLALDEAFQKERSAKKTIEIKQKPVSKNMNNFERRAYDMDSLEEQLLNSN